MMNDTSRKPTVRQPEAAGTPGDRRDPLGNDRGEAPTNPKTSGAPKPAEDPLKSPVANRNPGPRKAGMSPRPTDKPID